MLPESDGDRTKRREPSWSRRAMSVHRWSGLLGGLVFVLMGLSGALLVFHEELDAALFPGQLQADPTRGEWSVTRAVQSAQRALPGARILGVALPSPERPRVLKVQVRRGSSAHAVLVDPYTGEVRGVRARGSRMPSLREDPVSWAYRFHYQLAAGKRGQLITVLASLLLLLSVLSGAFVYRKHLLTAVRFRVRVRGASTRTRVSSLHRVGGTWALGLNLLLAVSGFWMIHDTVTPGFWQPSRPLPAAASPVSRWTYDDALAAAERAVPGFVPSWIDLGTTPGGTARFTLRGRHPNSAPVWGRHSSAVVLEASSLQVVETRRPERLPLGAQLDGLAFPLHQGHWGGLPVKLLFVLAGLSLPLLSLSGTWLWLRRRARSAVATAGAGRPVSFR